MTPITGPILLPSTPAPKTDSPFMVDWGGALTPVNGGAVQHLDRVGTRHGKEIAYPPMPTEPVGRIFASRLRQAQLLGALVPWRQDDFVNLVIGAPAVVVDGAGQSGMVLAMRGADPRGSVVQEGQAFSISHTGRWYLYFAAADIEATADGKLVVPIYPMLRAFPDDGDLCEFAEPMLQGSLSGNQTKWQRLTAPWTDVGTITITEDE